MRQIKKMRMHNVVHDSDIKKPGCDRKTDINAK